MEIQKNSDGQRATICVIKDRGAPEGQLDTLLACLDYPVAVFETPDAFLDVCQDLEIACILADADWLGDSYPYLLKELAVRGLAGTTIVMSRNADVDDAVKALQSGVADYVEIPMPGRLLLAKIQELIN